MTLPEYIKDLSDRYPGIDIRGQAEPERIIYQFVSQVRDKSIMMSVDGPEVSPMPEEFIKVFYKKHKEAVRERDQRQEATQ